MRVIGLSADPVNLEEGDMEILVRWKCPRCQVLGGMCPECSGTGYAERWIPMDMLKELPVGWIILARRFQDPSHLKD